MVIKYHDHNPTLKKIIALEVDGLCLEFLRLNESY